jgi:hypothetical protein
LPPVAGAIAQEIIDVVAVLNALRAAWFPPSLTDYDRAEVRPTSSDKTTA